MDPEGAFAPEVPPNVDVVPEPGRRAAARAGWITGINNCATREDGSVQTPSGFCYFWLVLMALGFAVSVGSSAQLALARPADAQTSAPKANDVSACEPVSRWRYQLAAVLGACVGFLNLFIFYNHCARCNGGSGFAITLAVAILWGIASHLIAPACLLPPPAAPPGSPN